MVFMAIMVLLRPKRVNFLAKTTVRIGRIAYQDLYTLDVVIKAKNHFFLKRLKKRIGRIFIKTK